METITIKKENAVNAYNSAKGDLKKFLETLLGKEILSGNIIDRIKTFDDACDVLKSRGELDPVLCRFTTSVSGNSPVSIISAFAKLIIIAQALNEGWEPDWKNSDEYKYYPWFDMSSGSGLSFNVYGYSTSTTSVGSRLCFKSRELAEYAGKQFLDLYKDLFLL